MRFYISLYLPFSALSVFVAACSDTGSAAGKEARLPTSTVPPIAAAAAVPAMAPEGLTDRLFLGHMARHCMHWMHSTDMTASFSGMGIPMLQALVQSPQFVQESPWRLILYSRFPETIANSAPRGHRYRQKKRPTNREPTAIANSSPNPTVGMAEETRERFPEISIPNTPQGLQEESTGSASTQTPAVIRTNIAYFRYFRMRSNRFGICTFPQTVFLEKRK